ncbi:MAG: hypothetical protein JWN02_690 [Acidobacteria bacterium]|nr:hypothetical protein [Acidobacteriota bacterium]
MEPALRLDHGKTQSSVLKVPLPPSRTRVTIPLMLSFSPELEALRDRGALDAATAARLIARERREPFSIYPELRTLTWLGVMLIVSGVGIIIAKHLDEIGPLTLAIVIALASAACYVWAWIHRREPALLDEYLLLLASLLLSADAGFIEHQFHLLGDQWVRHLLFLAIAHGVVAYLYTSRTVLALSIGALAGYLGIERNLDAFWRSGIEVAVRAFFCAAIVLIWREVDRRWRPQTNFSDVFAHFGANLAFWGALILTFHEETQYLGVLLVMGIGAAAAVHAFRSGREAFLLYAYVYTVIAADRVIVSVLRSEALAFFYLLTSTVLAIIGLFVAHARFRARRLA